VSRARTPWLQVSADCDDSASGGGAPWEMSAHEHMSIYISDPCRRAFRSVCNERWTVSRARTSCWSRTHLHALRSGHSRSLGGVATSRGLDRGSERASNGGPLMALTSSAGTQAEHTRLQQGAHGTRRAGEVEVASRRVALISLSLRARTTPGVKHRSHRRSRLLPRSATWPSDNHLRCVASPGSALTRA
jgi:hypothetical protein